jgi:competence protein ComEC
MKTASGAHPLLYLFFAAGCALSVAVHTSPWFLLPALLLLAVCVARGGPRWAAFPLLLVAGLSLGALRAPVAAPDLLVDEVLREGTPTFRWVRGQVLRAEPWTDGCRADLATSAFLEGDRWVPAACTIRCYLPVTPPLPGAELETSLRLSAPRGRNNPGQVDSRALLERDRVALTGTARSPELVRVVSEEGWHPLGRYLRALEARLLEDGGRSGGALLAILLGERGLMDPSQVDALSASGLYHLVALSGFNVGLLLLALAALCHTLGVHPRTRDLSALALLAAYGLLVAGQPSLGRSLIMAAIFLLAQLLARPQGGLLAWSASAALLLAYDPSWVLDAGFQLTFAATLGILLLWDAYPRRVPRSGAWGSLIRLHWVGFAALLGTLPFVLLTFNRISLLGWLATPLASLPLMAVQALGTVYIFGAAFVPGVHQVLGWTLDVLTRLFLLLPTWLGEGRWGTLFLPRPAWGWVAGYGLSLALLCVPGRSRRAGWVLLVFCVVGAVAAPALSSPEATPSLAVLDVGQASCQVLRWGRHAVLVDAGNGAYRGPTSGRSVVEPYLAAAGIGRLDGLVVTHWDEDHSGSAPDLLMDLPVGFLAYPATDPPERGISRRIADLCRRRGVRLVALHRGDALALDGASVRVLNPPLLGSEPDENDRSLVMAAAMPHLEVLFTGDLEMRGERSLLSAGVLSPTQVLVVPHHGSGTSSTPGFVSEVSPRLALFSVGRGNRFGHPSTTVVDRYRQLGSRVGRTDRDGALFVQGRRGLPLWRMRDGDWLEQALGR